MREDYRDIAYSFFSIFEKCETCFIISEKTIFNRANGYILKQSLSEQLINVLRAVGSGNSFLDSTLTEKVMGGYIRRSTALQNAEKVQLTDREVEVFRLIAWGYGNKQFAEQLASSVKTVEAHKANSMRKLGLTSRTDIIRYALLQGWLEET